MKKALLTIFSFIGLSTASFAQITNLDFEAWISQGNPKPYDKAAQWSTWNDAFYPLDTAYTAFKSTSAHGGMYAMRLETKAKPQFNDTMAGIALFGSITFIPLTQTIKIRGKAFTQRPSGVTGYYKYSTPGIDAALIAIFITKWNGSSTDTLGVGYAAGAPVANYTSFTAAVNYDPAFNGVVPDTMLLFFASSANEPNIPGSVLHIDDVSLIGVDLSSVHQLSTEASEAYSVYPNPASEALSISASRMGMNRTFVMYDAVGREVVNMKIEELTTTISLAHLPEGLFFYKITGSGTAVISSGKFNILR